MIPQLVARWAVSQGISLEDAGGQVLTADPFDLFLEMELVWDRANLGSPNPPPAGTARRFLLAQGQFFDAAQPPQNSTATPTPPAWHHLGYSLAIENTRAIQILARVVRLFRTGESLGIPGQATQRWVDTTEALLGGARRGLGWSPGSPTPLDPEAERRNKYYRLFGMDLAFGTEGNTAYPYEKAAAANTTFVPLFEELLHELWQAIENVHNLSGANQTDDDRIYRLAEQLAFMLRARRQQALLGWDELAASTVTGWAELTLGSDNPVIRELRADATNAADRLKIIGDHVGLPAHSRATSFFSMASELSLLLRTLEARAVQDATQSWLLYRDTPAPAIGAQVRRVITEWSAASGRSLKQRPRTPVVAARPLVLTKEG